MLNRCVNVEEESFGAKHEKEMSFAIREKDERVKRLEMRDI